jgi:hypothetical protein
MKVRNNKKWRFERPFYLLNHSPAWPDVCDAFASWIEMSVYSDSYYLGVGTTPRS